MASVIVVVIIFVLLALAILFICQNGGWQGGCGGNALVKAFPAGKAFFKWLCFPILFSFPGFAFLLPYA